MTPAEIAALSVSETLTAAADKLDALLAGLACPSELWAGSWTADEIFVRDGAGDAVAEPYYVGEVGVNLNRYIAAMDPIVGRALVAWLREEGADARGYDPERVEALFVHELVIARAILGGES